MISYITRISVAVSLRLSPIFWFVAAQRDTRSNEHNETEGAKIYEQSRHSERKVPRWCGVKEEMKTLRKQGRRCVPAHGKHKSMAERPRAEGWLAAEGNNINRQPGRQQKGEYNPDRETWEQRSVKSRLPRCSDEQSPTCDI
jgi:hypothetical protein